MVRRPTRSRLRQPDLRQDHPGRQRDRPARCLRLPRRRHRRGRRQHRVPPTPPRCAPLGLTGLVERCWRPRPPQPPPQCWHQRQQRRATPPVRPTLAANLSSAGRLHPPLPHPGLGRDPNPLLATAGHPMNPAMRSSALKAMCSVHHCQDQAYPWMGQHPMLRTNYRPHSALTGTSPAPRLPGTLCAAPAMVQARHWVLCRLRVRNLQLDLLQVLGACLRAYRRGARCLPPGLLQVREVCLWGCLQAVRFLPADLLMIWVDYLWRHPAYVSRPRAAFLAFPT